MIHRLAMMPRPMWALWGEVMNDKVQAGLSRPVRVQSMTNTDAEDAIGTAIQVKELALAGSELVRITVNTPAAAQALSKYRINPCNVGKGEKRDVQFGQMVEAAIRWDKPIRIGVSWGNLDQELLASMMGTNIQRAEPWDAKRVMYEALITSALESAQQALSIGLAASQFMLSCKVSGVPRTRSALRLPLAPGPGPGPDSA